MSQEIELSVVVPVRNEAENIGALVEEIKATRRSMPAVQSTRKDHERPHRIHMANKPYGALYTGVTSNLIQRVYQHKGGLIPGFTRRYGCKTLVWYEQHGNMENAITREKQLKAGSRADKLRLIEAMNPDWADLYPSLL